MQKGGGWNHVEVVRQMSPGKRTVAIHSICMHTSKHHVLLVGMSILLGLLSYIVVRLKAKGTKTDHLCDLYD